MTLKKIAKFEGMPRDQFARLADDCDNLLHTVRLNALLRPQGGSATQGLGSRARSYDGDAASLFTRGREGSLSSDSGA